MSNPACAYMPADVVRYAGGTKRLQQHARPRCERSQIQGHACPARSVDCVAKNLYQSMRKVLVWEYFQLSARIVFFSDNEKIEDGRACAQRMNIYKQSPKLRPLSRVDT